MIRAIGTSLPRWAADGLGVPGDDEDAVTMAVAAGLRALDAVPDSRSAVTTVVLVCRDFPLLVGGNRAPLLAGLGLGEEIAVREQLGGAPDVLEAVAGADTGTLVIGVDTTAGAGAAAALCSDSSGAPIVVRGRVNRSLPVVTRSSSGVTTDYADARLLREMGVGVSLADLGLDAGGSPVGAVAGVGRREAAALTVGDAPALPTSGASAALFALASVVERGGGATVLAIEQANVVAAELGPGPVVIDRDEPQPSPPPQTRMTSEADVTISLAAYARAFDAKLRLEAARCTNCGTLSYPHRYRCLHCGSEAPTDTVALPRAAEIYTLATIHVAVPGLATPYTVVLVELGDSGVRLLARLTGAAAGSVAIGDRGQMVLRRVAVRNGVPDYGYAFLPASVGLAAAPMEVSA